MVRDAGEHGRCGGGGSRIVGGGRISGALLSGGEDMWRREEEEGRIGQWWWWVWDSMWLGFLFALSSLFSSIAWASCYELFLLYHSNLNLTDFLCSHVPITNSYYSLASEIDKPLPKCNNGYFLFKHGIIWILVLKHLLLTPHENAYQVPKKLDVTVQKLKPKKIFVKWQVLMWQITMGSYIEIYCY